MDNILPRKAPAAREKVAKVLAQKRSRWMKAVSGTCKAEVVSTSQKHIIAYRQAPNSDIIEHKKGGHMH